MNRTNFISTRVRMVLPGLVAILVLGLLLAGCSPAVAPTTVAPGPAPATPVVSVSPQDVWNKVVAEAKKEGQLTVYSSNGPELNNGLAKIAREKFGLEMDFVAGGGAQPDTKYLAQRRAGINSGDLRIGGATNILFILKKEGMLRRLDDRIINPEAADPKAWPDGHPNFLDDDRLAIAMTGAYWSYILVNTEMVKEADLKAYQDLVDPRWKGKLGLYRPVGTGAGVNWVMFIWELVMGPEKADKYLTQLAAQEPAISDDTRQLTEWVARGKYPIAIAPSSIDVVADFRKAGAPIAWKRMSEGGFIHPAGSCIAIFKDAPHPNAALVIFNYLLTAEGQSFYSSAYSQPPVRLGVTAPGVDPFTVPVPGEKLYRWNEKFGQKVIEEGTKVGQKYFGSLLK